MSFFRKYLFVILIALAVFVGLKIHSAFRVPEIPQLNDTWWGPGEQVREDHTIKSFKIIVADEVLTDLTNRLNQARPFTPPLEGVQQQYGMNTDLLKEIVEFWKSKYDWREREQYLNKFPQFKTKIQGLDIHFIRAKPTTTTNLPVVPLLLLHGWPGSVREFYELIPLLTTPQKSRNFVFDVIAPSLPGFGFSQGAAKPGLGAAQIGVVLNNLMKRLGFEQYYLQGGDWGGIIAFNMAVLRAKNILGMHSNFCVVNTPYSHLMTIAGSFYPSLVVEEKFEKRMYPLLPKISNMMLESGYLHVQATKPDTIAVGLNDSPVGLLAFILEKFTTATNPAWREREDGGLKLKFSYTDLLDNIMYYWIPGSYATAARLYSESFNKVHFSLEIEKIPIEIPSACARFPHEISFQSESILKSKLKQLLQVSDPPRGGHFAAMEEPQLLADDIWSAVEKFRAVHHNSN